MLLNRVHKTRLDSMNDLMETPAERLLRAKNKIIDLLSRRDHSSKELIQKLLRLQFTKEEATAAIAWAQEQRYLRPPGELAESRAASLHRKGKGIAMINRDLHSKGLPSVELDSDLELEKAQDLIARKFAKIDLRDRKNQDKICRSLLTRGFQLSIAKRAIQMVLKDTTAASFEPEDSFDDSEV